MTCNDLNIENSNKVVNINIIKKSIGIAPIPERPAVGPETYLLTVQTLPVFT